MRVLFFLLLIISSFSWSDHDEGLDTNDCIPVILNNEAFDSAVLTYIVESMELNGDCLSLNVGVSGCDAENHDVKMIGRNQLDTDVDVPTMTFKLTENVNQICLAYFVVPFEYDLSELKSITDSAIPLTFVGSDKTIMY